MRWRVAWTDVAWTWHQQDMMDVRVDRMWVWRGQRGAPCGCGLRVEVVGTRTQTWTVM